VKVVGAAAFAALVLAGASASAAERAFPGRNGRIVFVSDRTSPIVPEIYAVGLDGRGRRNLTRNTSWDSAPLPSPDGTRVLFRSDRQGGPELWLMDADGRAPRLLGTGEHPTWAPDGRRIAFEDGRGGIAVRDLESGTVSTVARGSLPAWSPDGARIAFVFAGFGPELHVVRPDGSDQAHLAHGVVLAGVLVHPPVWSPDGRRLAIAGGAPDSYRSASSSDLWVVRADNGVQRALVLGSGVSDPAWAPDGRSLAFVRTLRGVSGSQLMRVDADGGAAQPLTSPPRLFYDGGPAWSPDGAWIAFWRGRTDANGSEVALVRPDGSELRRVTPPRIAVPLYEGPVWAPDGSTVLYASASSDRDSDLFSIEPDGSAVRRLTDNLVEDTEPSWSPDGSRIVFVRRHVGGTPGRGSSNEEIHVMRADGSGVRRLTERAFEDLSPSWSPDGGRIVFVRRVRRLGVLGIYTMRAEGGRVRRLTPREGFYSSPVWSPDGRRIAFTEGSGVGEGGRLYVMDADGSRVRRLADVAELAVGPRWSPDGRSLAVVGVTSCGGSCATSAIYVVGLDGSFRELSGTGAKGIAWAPDGTELAVARGEIAALAANGSGTRRVTYAGASDVAPDWQPRCTHTGSAGADRLAGTAAADLVCGRGGDDRLTGGRGSDRLFGGDGDDAIEARDGAFDVVGCGPGRDTVAADRRDLVGVDCERVARG
jgi:TolB protein